MARPYPTVVFESWHRSFGEASARGFDHKIKGSIWHNLRFKLAKRAIKEELINFYVDVFASMPAICDQSQKFQNEFSSTGFTHAMLPR